MDVIIDTSALIAVIVGESERDRIVAYSGESGQSFRADSGHLFR